jgi:hypothetical protein
MATEQTDPQYKLRWPEELRDKVVKAAEENRRSINAEIIARLSVTFLDDQLASASPNFDKLLQLVADIAAEKAAIKTVERLYEYERLPPEEKEHYVKQGAARERAEQQRSSTLDLLPPHIVDLIDQWIAGQPDPKPSREEALNIIVRGEANTNIPAHDSPSRKLTFRKAGQK